MKRFFNIVLIIILFGSRPFLFAQWRVTGKLLQGRQGQSAVKLSNEKVLVSGGLKTVGYSFKPLSSCEIYDPKLETWSEVAPMNFPRYSHSSLLLPNNRILVIGGFSTYGGDSPYGGNLSSCEIYNPELNIWQLTDSLLLKSYHGNQEAIMCPNGEVFLICWAESSANRPSYFIGQIYDYKTGKWALTDTLNGIDAGFRLSCIKDSVLVIGGIWGDRNCAIYNTSLNSWELFAQMNEGRANHTATILSNGNILVTGGEDYRGTSIHPKLTCEIFNINTMEWNYVAPMNYSRLGHEAVLLKNGKVLVERGSYDMGSYPRIETEIYDPVFNVWKYAGNLTSYPSSYKSQTLIALDDSSVLVIGLYSPPESDYSLCNRLFYNLTGIRDGSLKGKLLKFELFQNYPNPFNPSTTINYEIPKSGLVKIKIYDVLGREIEILVNEYKNPGKYKVDFNDSNLSSGIYFYRITTNNYSETKKMLLIK